MRRLNIKRFFVVMLMACMLFTQGQMPAAAAETGVVLYKNDVQVGEYTSINNAFAQMTDSSANYKVALKNDQTLSGYANWPAVNSIKIMPFDLQMGVVDGKVVNLIITEDTVTAQSDVCFSDWICVRPEQQSGKVSYMNFNIQGNTLTFDQEVSGHTVALGCQESSGYTGINIVGSTGSKVVLNETVCLYNSSLQVDTLEMNVENSASSSELMAHEIALYDSAKINTAKTVIARYGNGITLSNADMQISTFEAVENPVNASVPVTQYLWLEGESNVTVGDMYENCKLQIDYLDMNTVKKSVVSLTGNKSPQAVMLSVAVNHKIYNADESRAFSFDNIDGYLLYAPNLAEGAVTATCSIYNDLNGETVGQYSYYGEIDGTNGYYNMTAIPTISFSDSFFMTDTWLTEELEYLDANKNGDLSSVSWSIYEIGANGYVDHPEWTKKFGWDKDSLGFGLTGLNSTSTYFLKGYFTYDDGTVSVLIPIFTSPVVSNASFNTTELTLIKPNFTSSQLVKLSYTAATTPEVIWTTSNPGVVSIVGTGVNASQKINGYGTAVVRAYLGKQVVECTIFVTDQDVYADGWHKGTDGNWYYYIDGKVDTSVNGIIYNGDFSEYWYAIKGKADFTVNTVAYYGGNWWYVSRGKIDFTYTGLGSNYEGWWYIKNGKVDTTYEGVVSNASGRWYVKNGKVDFSINGLVACGGSWYYFKNGAVQNVTGLYSNSLGYWYVKDGQVDFTYFGLAENSAGRWYVKNGAVNFNINGLSACGDGWYYFKNGAVQNVTGLYQNSSGWWYVKNGEIQLTYFGLVENTYGYWYVKNGRVDFSVSGVAQCGEETDWYYFEGGIVKKATGLYESAGEIWYVVDGKVDFEYFGLLSHDGNQWYVKNGKINTAINGLAQCGKSTDWYYFKDGAVQKVTGLYSNAAGWWFVYEGKINFEYTGLASNSIGWWYVKNGQVDFDYEGLACNTNGWWYLKSGKVDFTYDGVAENENGTWYIEDGKVDFSKSGILLRSGVWYYFKGGAVQFIDTVTNNSAGWWAVRNGIVDFTFDGIAENSMGLWYCVDSKVDFNFNGTVEFEGHTYKVVNGRATLIQ